MTTINPLKPEAIAVALDALSNARQQVLNESAANTGKINAALNALAQGNLTSLTAALATAVPRDYYADGAARAADGTVISKGPEYPVAALTGRSLLMDSVDGTALTVTRTTQAIGPSGQATAAGALPGSVNLNFAPPITYERDHLNFIAYCCDAQGTVWGSNASATLMRLRQGQAEPEIVKVFDRGVVAMFISLTGAIFVSVATNIYNPPASGGGQLWRSLDGGTTWTKVLDFMVGAPYRWSFAENGTSIICAEYGYKSADAQANHVYRSTDNGATWTMVYSLGNLDGRHIHALCWDRYSNLYWMTHGDKGGFDTTEANQYQRLMSSPDGINWTPKAYGVQPIWLLPTQDAVYMAGDSYPQGVGRYDKATGVVSFPLNLETRGKTTPYSTQSATLFKAGPNGPYVFATYAQTANVNKESTIWVSNDLQGWTMVDNWGVSKPTYGGTGIVHGFYNPVDGLVYGWAYWTDAGGVDRIGTRVLRVLPPHSVPAVHMGRSSTNYAAANLVDPTNTSGASAITGATISHDPNEKWRTPGNGSIVATLPGAVKAEGMRLQQGSVPNGPVSAGCYLWSSPGGYYTIILRDPTSSTNYGVLATRTVAIPRQPTWFDFGTGTIAGGIVALDILCQDIVPGQKLFAAGARIVAGSGMVGRPEISGARNADVIRKNHVQAMGEGTFIARVRLDFDSEDNLSGQPMVFGSLSGGSETVKLVMTAGKVLQFQVGATAPVYVATPALSFARRDEMTVVGRWKAGQPPTLTYVLRGKRVTTVGAANAPAIGANSTYFNPGCEEGQNRSFEGALSFVVLPKMLTEAQLEGELSRRFTRQLP